MTSYANRSSGLRTKHPWTCHWLYRMREFNDKYRVKCKMEPPEPVSKSHEFMTGSYYEGGWQDGCGMHGYGVYTFPNGVIYEGEFFEGAFHGKGELRYQTPAAKAVIRGQWNKGLMTDRTVIYDDAVEHDANNWQYCKMPDRRFTREYADDVQPGGKSFMTAYHPYVEVPEGYVDTGDGFFDPLRKMIYQHDVHTKILRGPTEPVRRGPSRREQNWILENCRIGKKDMTIGPRQDLYEKYMEPTALLEPVPPPPTKFMATNRKQSIWNVDKDREDPPAFYDASKCGTDAGLPERKFKPGPIPTTVPGHE